MADRCPGDGRDIGMVIGWRHLDHVGADHDRAASSWRSTDRILAEDGPPATGVPVPGAKAGSRQSMSKVT